MASSDNPPKAFHAPVLGTVYHNDGREGSLLTHLQSIAPFKATDDVLHAIDTFGEGQYLMNVGKYKGPEVERVMKERKVGLVLELGAYVGYSAVEFGRCVQQDGVQWGNEQGEGSESEEWKKADDAQKRAYVSVEYSKEYTRVARGVAELAGLSSTIKIFNHPSTNAIPLLRQILSLSPTTTFDMVFLDHIKPLYLPDLHLLEELGLIGPGTILVADNVIKPGNPPYLEYVRADTQQKAKWRREGGRGRPGLKYKSRLHDGYDPYTAEKDGVEFTECVGIDDEVDAEFGGVSKDIQESSKAAQEAVKKASE